MPLELLDLKESKRTDSKEEENEGHPPFKKGLASTLIFGFRASGMKYICSNSQWY